MNNTSLIVMVAIFPWLFFPVVAPRLFCNSVKPWLPRYLVLLAILLFGCVGNKGRGKVQRLTCREITKGKKRYSYALSLTSALNGVGVGGHASAA